jgi:hypothetical protein
MDRSRVQIPRAVLEALLPHGAALQLFAWLLAHAHGEARRGHARGRSIDLAPGEVVLGARSVGRELGLSYKAVRCALELLERMALVTCRGAQSRAHLGAQNGSVVSLINPCAYLHFSDGEGRITGRITEEAGAQSRAQTGAQNALEKVPVIEPPYMQHDNEEGRITGRTIGRTSPGESPENGLAEAENGGATNKDINISLKNTSYPNSKGSSKERNLKVYSAISEDEAGSADEPGTLRGRKCTLKGKRASTFLLFWEAFDYKKDRAQAIDAWAQIPTLTNMLVEKICAAARRYATVERPAILARGGTPKYAQGWLNDRRWEDECQIPPEEDYSFLERFGGSA